MKPDVWRRDSALMLATWMAALAVVAAAPRIVVADEDPAAPTPGVVPPATPTPIPAPLSDLPPVAAIELSGVEARGAALLMTGQSGGDVSGAVLWTATPEAGGGGAVSVPFVVEIDGATLLEPSAGGRIPLEIYGYLVDDDGTVVDHLADGVLLDDARHGRHVRHVGLRYVGTFRLEAGVYSFRVLVRNRENGRYFLFREDLEVPAPGRREPFLLPPMAPAPDAPWLVAAQHGLDAANFRQTLPGLDGWPTVRPGWPAQQPLEIVLGATAFGDGLSVSARLITASGREVDEPEVVIGGRVASSDRLVFHRATIGAPDLPAGEYRLVVRLADSDSGQTVSRSLPVIIHGGESPLVWTDPAAPRRPPRRQPRRQPRPTAEQLREEMLQAGSLRDGYLAALGLLADGDFPNARRALARLERRVGAASTARSWTLLRATEWDSARRLAERRPDSMMAMILFHREMYRWYGARYESELAEHSWHLAAALVEESAKLAGWQPPEGFAEGVLLDLAGDLAKAAHVRPAQYLLEVALALTPRQPQALLGLGALHERAGEPRLAVGYLQELLDARADHHEARLRLAVNRQRLGNRKAAERLLEDLLARSAPSWIRIVAYQELCGLMIRSKYHNEAEQLLLRAIEEYPRNQRLRILLAYVLDAAGRPGEATAVIERLEAAASQHSTSPRHRYGAWPDLEPEGLHEVLAQGQRRGVDALREALP